MKITILYQYFQGLNEPGHGLLLALAQLLQAKKEDVVVVSGEYGYMDPKSVRVPLWRRLMRRETVDGVPVIRTYTYPYGHRSFSARSLSFLSFSVSSLFALFRGPRPDVIYASTPPLLPMLSAWVASKIRRSPLVLEVRDLWPASIVQLGTVRNRLALAVMWRLERLLYDQAAQIVVLTDGIRQNIVERGWPEQKVHMISYGVSPARFFPDEAQRQRTRAAAGWSDEKIVMYVGAHGPANNLDVMLRAAHRLRRRPDIRFVLIGNGMEKARLVETAKAMGLDNVLFHPPVPASETPGYINAADLCVATLRDIPLFEGAIPTKLIEYMACGRSVVISAKGEAETIVRAAGAGTTCEPDDDAAFAEQIEALADDPERRSVLGRNGSEYAHRHFSLERNQAALHALLATTARDHARRSAS
jgi:glycosyltransferase involved in cell wall biosynthesis